MLTVTCSRCNQRVLYPIGSVMVEKQDKTRYFICVKCFDEKCGLKREDKNNGN